MTTDKTPLNADDELREELRELTEDVYNEEHYDELMRVIISDRKKHELQAKIDELGHCCGKCGVWHSETCNISKRRLTFRERINELKQELEKYE